MDHHYEVERSLEKKQNEFFRLLKFFVNVESFENIHLGLLKHPNTNNSLKF